MQRDGSKHPGSRDNGNLRAGLLAGVSFGAEQGHPSLQTPWPRVSSAVFSCSGVPAPYHQHQEQEAAARSPFPCSRSSSQRAPVGNGTARPPPPPPLLPFPGQPAAVRLPCRDRGRPGWLAGGASPPRSRVSDPQSHDVVVVASSSLQGAMPQRSDVPRWLQDPVTPSSCRAEGLNPGWAPC